MRIVDMKTITNVERRACEHCQTVLSPMQHGFVVSTEGKEHVFCGQRCAEHFLHGKEKKPAGKTIVV